MDNVTSVNSPSSSHANLTRNSASHCPNSDHLKPAMAKSAGSDVLKTDQAFPFPAVAQPSSPSSSPRLPGRRLASASAAVGSTVAGGGAGSADQRALSMKQSKSMSKLLRLFGLGSSLPATSTVTTTSAEHITSPSFLTKPLSKVQEVPLSRAATSTTTIADTQKPQSNSSTSSSSVSFYFRRQNAEEEKTNDNANDNHGKTSTTNYRLDRSFTLPATMMSSSKNSKVFAGDCSRTAATLPVQSVMSSTQADGYTPLPSGGRLQSLKSNEMCVEEEEEEIDLFDSDDQFHSDDENFRVSSLQTPKNGAEIRQQNSVTQPDTANPGKLDSDATQMVDELSSISEKPANVFATEWVDVAFGTEQKMTSGNESDVRPTTQSHQLLIKQDPVLNSNRLPTVASVNLQSVSLTSSKVDTVGCNPPQLPEKPKPPSSAVTTTAAVADNSTRYSSNVITILCSPEFRRRRDMTSVTSAPCRRIATTSSATDSNIWLPLQSEGGAALAGTNVGSRSFLSTGNCDTILSGVITPCLTADLQNVNRLNKLPNVDIPAEKMITAIPPTSSTDSAHLTEIAMPAEEPVSVLLKETTVSKTEAFSLIDPGVSKNGSEREQDKTRMTSSLLVNPSTFHVDNKISPEHRPSGQGPANMPSPVFVNSGNPISSRQQPIASNSRTSVGGNDPSKSAAATTTTSIIRRQHRSFDSSHVHDAVDVGGSTYVQQIPETPKTAATGSVSAATAAACRTHNETRSATTVIDTSIASPAAAAINELEKRKSDSQLSIGGVRPAANLRPASSVNTGVVLVPIEPEITAVQTLPTASARALQAVVDNVPFVADGVGKISQEVLPVSLSSMTVANDDVQGRPEYVGERLLSRLLMLNRQDSYNQPGDDDRTSSTFHRPIDLPPPCDSAILRNRRRRAEQLQRKLHPSEDHPGRRRSSGSAKSAIGSGSSPSTDDSECDENQRHGGQKAAAASSTHSLPPSTSNMQSQEGLGLFRRMNAFEFDSDVTNSDEESLFISSSSIVCSSNGSSSGSENFSSDNDVWKRQGRPETISTTSNNDESAASQRPDIPREEQTDKTSVICQSVKEQVAGTQLASTIDAETVSQLDSKDYQPSPQGHPSRHGTSVSGSQGFVYSGQQQTTSFNDGVTAFDSPRSESPVWRLRSPDGEQHRNGDEPVQSVDTAVGTRGPITSDEINDVTDRKNEVTAGNDSKVDYRSDSGQTSSAQSDVDTKVTSQLAGLAAAAAKGDIVDASRRRRQRGLASVAAGGGGSTADPQPLASPEQQPIPSDQHQPPQQHPQQPPSAIDRTPSGYSMVNDVSGSVQTELASTIVSGNQLPHRSHRRSPANYPALPLSTNSNDTSELRSQHLQGDFINASGGVPSAAAVPEASAASRSHGRTHLTAFEPRRHQDRSDVQQDVLPFVSVADPSSSLLSADDVRSRHRRAIRSDLISTDLSTAVETSGSGRQPEVDRSQRRHGLGHGGSAAPPYQYLQPQPVSEQSTEPLSPVGGQRRQTQQPAAPMVGASHSTAIAAPTLGTAVVNNQHEKSAAATAAIASAAGGAVLYGGRVRQDRVVADVPTTDHRASAGTVGNSPVTAVSGSVLTAEQPASDWKTSATTASTSARTAARQLTPYEHRSHHQRDREELAALGQSLLKQQPPQQQQQQQRQQHEPPGSQRFFPDVTPAAAGTSASAMASLPVSQVLPAGESVVSGRHRSTSKRSSTEESTTSTSTSVPLTTAQCDLTVTRADNLGGSCTSLDSISLREGVVSPSFPVVATSGVGNDVPGESDNSSEARRRRRAALVRSRTAAAASATAGMPTGIPDAGVEEAKLTERPTVKATTIFEGREMPAVTDTSVSSRVSLPSSVPTESVPTSVTAPSELHIHEAVATSSNRSLPAVPTTSLGNVSTAGFTEKTDVPSNPVISNEIQTNALAPQTLSRTEQDMQTVTESKKADPLALPVIRSRPRTTIYAEMREKALGGSATAGVTTSYSLSSLPSSSSELNQQQRQWQQRAPEIAAATTSSAEVLSLESRRQRRAAHIAMMTAAGNVQRGAPSSGVVVLPQSTPTETIAATAQPEVYTLPAVDAKPSEKESIPSTVCSTTEPVSSTSASQPVTQRIESTPASLTSENQSASPNQQVDRRSLDESVPDKLFLQQQQSHSLMSTMPLETVTVNNQVGPSIPTVTQAAISSLPAKVVTSSVASEIKATHPATTITTTSNAFEITQPSATAAVNITTPEPVHRHHDSGTVYIDEPQQVDRNQEAPTKTDQQSHQSVEPSSESLDAQQKIVNTARNSGEEISTASRVSELISTTTKSDEKQLPAPTETVVTVSTAVSSSSVEQQHSQQLSQQLPKPELLFAKSSDLPNVQYNIPTADKFPDRFVAECSNHEALEKRETVLVDVEVPNYTKSLHAVIEHVSTVTDLRQIPRTQTFCRGLLSAPLKLENGPLSRIERTSTHTANKEAVEECSGIGTFSELGSVQFKPTTVQSQSFVDCNSVSFTVTKSLKRDTPPPPPVTRRTNQAEKMLTTANGKAVINVVTRQTAQPVSAVAGNEAKSASPVKEPLVEFQRQQQQQQQQQRTVTLLPTNFEQQQKPSSVRQPSERSTGAVRTSGVVLVEDIDELIAINEDQPQPTAVVDSRQSNSAGSMGTEVATSKAEFPRLVSGKSWQAVVSGGSGSSSASPVPFGSSAAISETSGSGAQLLLQKRLMAADRVLSSSLVELTSCFGADGRSSPGRLSPATTQTTLSSSAASPSSDNRTVGGNRLKPILRKAKTVEAAEIDPELAAVLRVRKNREDQQLEQERPEQELVVANEAGKQWTAAANIYAERCQQQQSPRPQQPRYVDGAPIGHKVPAEATGSRLQRRRVPPPRRHRLSVPVTYDELLAAEKKPAVGQFRTDVMRFVAMNRSRLSTAGRQINPNLRVTFVEILRQDLRYQWRILRANASQLPVCVGDLFLLGDATTITPRSLAGGGLRRHDRYRPLPVSVGKGVRRDVGIAETSDSIDDLVAANDETDELSKCSGSVGRALSRWADVVGGEMASGPAEQSAATGNTLWSVEDDQTRTDEITEDDLCKLSLAEKMKLFSRKSNESATPASPSGGHKSKLRRNQARFKTQSYSVDGAPVTPGELEKAALMNRISPLALTLVKPPAPEYLATMPVKDQRQFVADWAVANLTTTLAPRQQQQQQQQPTGSGTAQQQSRNTTVSDSAPTSASMTSTMTRDVPSSTVSVNQSSNAGAIGSGNPAPSSSPIKGILKSASNAETQSPARNSTAGTSASTTNQPQQMQSPQKQQQQLPAAAAVRGILRKQKSCESEVDNQQSMMRDNIFHSQQQQQQQQQQQRQRQLEEISDSIDRDNDPTSSGGGGVVLRANIKNKAIARRRMMLEKQQQQLRLSDDYSETSNRSSSSSSVFADESLRRRLLSGFGGGGSLDSESPPRTGSFDDDDAFQPSSTVRGLQQQQMDDEDERRPRPTSIAQRLSLLLESQDSWKSKVEEKDIDQFTVEGKMNRLGVSAESSLPQKPRRSFKNQLSRARSTPNLSAPDPDENDDEGECTPAANQPAKFRGRPSGQSVSGSQTSEKRVSTFVTSGGPKRVEVPHFDDEDLAAFFASNWSWCSFGATRNGKVWKPSLGDFELVEKMARDRLLNPSRPAPPARHKQPSRNPLRALLQGNLIQFEYMEVRTDIAERELKRIKHEQILGTTHLAQEALAGLASTEDFTNVALRKTDRASRPSSVSAEYLPFTELMLLHIKGRRCCQTRLVEPCPSSINSGDCFVLVTPERVYLWTGEYCNVIEKAKATDVANQIYQKRDLGITTTCQMDIIAESLQTDTVGGPSRNFWKLLGSLFIASSQPPGRNDEDELYETYICETNIVYQLHDDELVVSDEYSGRPLKHNMLRTKEVYVFDFGSEMYVWTGKHVPFDRRKKVLRLALDIWDRGYDYTGYDINPLCPLIPEDCGGLPLSGPSRPSWAMFAKVNQNMETTLFKEKFIDWPESARVIKVKSTSKNDSKQKGEAAGELKPADIKQMLTINRSPISLILDGSHVGRGQKWEEMQAGIRREYEIVTHSIVVWHVLEYDHHKLPETSYGQFHEADTYVIRWHYSTLQIGNRTLRGDEARQSLVGRTRCAYFFWQGRHSSINEKGASALMTVELDEERGPQVRVVEGKEPPCFINLFSGRMIVHAGKRNGPELGLTPDSPAAVVATRANALWRMYAIRNELSGEAYLHEVVVGAGSLRSRTSFILLGLAAGILFIWHGVKAIPDVVRRAQEITLGLLNCCPPEIGLHDYVDKLRVLEMIEGSECASFWTVLGGGSNCRSEYCSLIKDPRLYDFSPRLFHMTSVSGVFEAIEIVNPAINHDGVPSAFAFLQSDLYNEIQPALFLVDNGHVVYLWQGWWPADSDTGREESASADVALLAASDSVRTGSTEVRFLANRKCAMQTTLQYCQAVNAENPPTAYLVYAGLEPSAFTNLFPYWEHDDTVKQLVIADGKQPGADLELVSEALSKLCCQTYYTWEDLQRRPLPDGVDPLRLEIYLTDEEFEELIGLTRQEFSSLPTWKQANIKKEVGLY